MSEHFALEFKVRDYECDLQGIVNNSVYQNYLEHTRHEFLLSIGVCFSSLAKQKIDLVVTRIEMDFIKPLVSKDEFIVKLRASQVSPIRFEFQQDIFRKVDNAHVLRGRVMCTALNERGRPFKFQSLIDLLGRL